jgi:hypothetical protein
MVVTAEAIQAAFSAEYSVDVRPQRKLTNTVDAATLNRGVFFLLTMITAKLIPAPEQHKDHSNHQEYNDTSWPQIPSSSAAVTTDHHAP